MNISSRDQRCRYVPAVGTRTDHLSPFGERLKRCGVTLRADCPLERMVEKGWVQPVLRVVLPPVAFDSWRNYPELYMEGFEDCPEADRWALNLWADAMGGSPPRQRGDWWVHFLDDPDDPLNRAARAAAVDPADAAALPPAFRHAHSGREIRPWLDYFAYWQVFPIAEVLDAMTCTVRLTDDLQGVARGLQSARQFAQERAQQIVAKWERRRPTFEWLSRVRTVLGASVSPDRSWEEIDFALRRVAGDMGLSPDRMKRHIRDTLLVMWREWSRKRSSADVDYGPLRELLRQEIQYAVSALERITRQPTDFLASHWYDARRCI